MAINTDSESTSSSYRRSELGAAMTLLAVAVVVLYPIRSFVDDLRESRVPDNVLLTLEQLDRIRSVGEYDAFRKTVIEDSPQRLPASERGEGNKTAGSKIAFSWPASYGTPDDSVALFAAQKSHNVFARIGLPQRTFPPIADLIKLIDDESFRDEAPFEARRVVFGMLAAMGEKAKPAIPSLRRAMRDDGSPAAAEATVTLIAIDASVEVGYRLAQLLTSRLPSNRAVAAQFVAEHLRPDIAKRLLGSLYVAESNADIRNIVALSLTEIPQDAVRSRGTATRLASR